MGVVIFLYDVLRLRLPAGELHAAACAAAGHVAAVCAVFGHAAVVYVVAAVHAVVYEPGSFAYCSIVEKFFMASAILLYMSFFSMLVALNHASCNILTSLLSSLP